MRQSVWSAAFAAGVCLAAAGAQASFVFSPTTGLDSSINSKGWTIPTSGTAVRQVGNTTYQTFNANSARRVFTFDSEDNYPAGNPQGVLPGTLNLSQALYGGPTSLSTSIAVSGTGTTRQVNQADGQDNFESSGDGAVITTYTTVTISFDNGVGAVGFTTNRSALPLTVKVFSDAGTTQIGSDYTLPAAGNGEHDFFGYTATAPTSIRQIQISQASAFQYGIDDLTVVPVPEPGLVGLSAGAATALLARRRRKC
jgi:hypothetical protein